jgi:hypothetical protein
MHLGLSRAEFMDEQVRQRGEDESHMKDELLDASLAVRIFPP